MFSLFKVVIRPKARRQLAKIHKKDRRAFATIDAALVTLEQFPSVNNVKALKNNTYDYRMRVGNYRILFDVHSKEVRVVLVQEVERRDDHTYS